MQKPQKYRNRLADESSPYLLQHAHNPVDWYPWGEEAFQRAKDEDKPVLLSIGYSACHWCHVMAHESFENENTAKIMNDNFVNIKVDMEERPDVDKIYMNFVQLSTGSGGWPLTTFLTPDQRPFFGGTYFPPTPRFNMPSFEQILTSISDAYRDQRAEILKSADEIVGEIRRVGRIEEASESVTTELLDFALQSFEKTFDQTNGGFGGAPKFPAPMALEFLLRYYKRTRNERALEMVTKSCRKMANGGIFDQLGGGFHRYTVDAIWLVPHFEKMLYDNAQLARIYLHLFQVTGDAFYRQVVEKTLDYIGREMLDEQGGFYSAQDADSEGVEGKFFVWEMREMVDLLDETDSAVVAHYYDVSPEGNFEGKNILNVKSSIKETAAAFSISEEEVSKILRQSEATLFRNREERVRPFKDEKVIAAWNGLMLTAFAEAGAVLGNKSYLEIAAKNADFLMDSMMRNGRLLRTWKNGSAKLEGYLEDYANVADGLYELFSVTGEEKYLIESSRLADAMIEEFWDEDNGGFYFTAADHEELLVRSKDYNDNATPSGNSAAFDVLLKLSKIYGNERYARHATTGLRIVASQVKRFPGAFGRALSAMEFHLASVLEIVIAGPRGSDLEEFVNTHYLPDTVVFLLDGDSNVESDLLMGRKMVDGKPTAYVCRNFTCQRPVTTVDDLIGLLK